VKIAQLTQQHTTNRRASIQHQLQKNNTNSKDHRQNRNTSIQTKFREKCIPISRDFFVYSSANSITSYSYLFIYSERLGSKIKNKIKNIKSIYKILRTFFVKKRDIENI